MFGYKNLTSLPSKPVQAPIKEAIEQFPTLAEHGTLGLLALCGSRAYGTDHAESDFDFRGFYVAPMRNVLRINARPPETFASDVMHDTTIYELAHFAKLAASGNPTVLEVLWASERVSGPLGGMLCSSDNRRAFLSKRIVKTYGGYALQQLKKVRAGSGGSRGHEHYKRTKFKMHTLRLIDAGVYALQTGEILVRHPHPEALMATAENCDFDTFETMVNAGVRLMDGVALSSKLPDEPDWDRINDMVYDLRTRVS